MNKGLTMAGVSAMTFGTIALIVAFSIIPAIGSQLDLSAGFPFNRANANLSFSAGEYANISDGEYVNFTLANGSVYSFQYNLSSSSEAFPANSIWVNVSSTWPRKQAAVNNLTVAINNNATLSGMLTAYNNTDMETIIYDTSGTGGNAIALSENVANASWSSTNLTGGAVPSQWDSSVNSSIPTAVDFWESVGGILKLAGFLAVVIGFVAGVKGIRS